MLTPGTAALVVSFPHAGTQIPEPIARRMTPAALAVQDTDWHLPQLYAFARSLGASLLVPQVSRYVIDLNRPPDDAPLYPGQLKTGLCPVETFRGQVLYQPGQAPSADEIAQRRDTYWQPYHRLLADELERLRSRHGAVLLWEAHSIASELPRLFAGRLPDLNLGTADGRSCDTRLQAAIERVLAAQQAFTSVVNGRFKGGYITRRYGQPHLRVHAVQLEQCQHTYMDEAAPFAYRADRAQQVQPVLERMLGAALDWVQRAC